MELSDTRKSNSPYYHGNAATTPLPALLRELFWSLVFSSERTDHAPRNLRQPLIFKPMAAPLVVMAIPNCLPEQAPPTSPPLVPSQLQLVDGTAVR